jgi:hypothetical protein
MKRTILTALAILLFLLGAPFSPAMAQERARPRWAIDVAPLAGIEPVHQDLGGGTALLYGADLRLRLAMVLLGFRLEKTNSSVAFGEQGFTRALGILGFNLGLGERTEISPYVGLGSAHPSGSSFTQSSLGNARLGIDLDYFLARFLSIGGGLAVDLWGHGYDGIVVSRAFSATVRLGFHLPLD